MQAVIRPFLDRKKLSIAEYCDYIVKPGSFADEVALYLIAKVSNLHVSIIYQGGEWYSCSSYNAQHCQILLVYIGGPLFIEVCVLHEQPKSSKPGGYHPWVNTVQPTDSSSGTEIYDPKLYNHR